MHCVLFGTGLAFAIALAEHLQGPSQYQRHEVLTCKNDHRQGRRKHSKIGGAPSHAKRGTL